MARVGARAHYQATFAVLALGVAAFAPLQSLVVPVLTTVQHELHTSQGAATWVLTAYLLSASVMTPILGRIGDVIGKERVFVATVIAGCLTGAAAMAILAFAHHQQWQIGLVLAALAGLLIPAVRRPWPPTGEPGGAQLAIAADGAVVRGDHE